MLNSSLRFQTIYFSSLSLDTRFQAYDDIVVFCLPSHSSMNKIDRGTDKRNIQEVTKLLVKASINEEKKVGSGRNIALFPATITIVHSEKALKRAINTAAELIFGWISNYFLHYIVTFVHFIQAKQNININSEQLFTQTYLSKKCE